jgi:hypothetical protein
MKDSKKLTPLDLAIEENNKVVTIIIINIIIINIIINIIIIIIIIMPVLNVLN